MIQAYRDLSCSAASTCSAEELCDVIQRFYSELLCFQLIITYPAHAEIHVTTGHRESQAAACASWALALSSPSDKMSRLHGVCQAMCEKVRKHHGWNV